MNAAEAVAKAKTKWWETATDEEIVRFQLYEERLCMPFGRFHEAVEACLDRPVFSHVFGMEKGVEQLKWEFERK